MHNDLLKSVLSVLKCDVLTPTVETKDVYIRDWLEIPLHDAKNKRVLDVHTFVYRGKFLLELVSDGVYVFTHDVITGNCIDLTAVDIVNILHLPLSHVNMLMRRASTFVDTVGSENKRANAYAVINGDSRIQLCIKNNYALNFIPKDILPFVSVVIVQWTKNKPLSCSALLKNDINLDFLGMKNVVDLIHDVPKIIKFVNYQPTKLYIELNCVR